MTLLVKCRRRCFSAGIRYLIEGRTHHVGALCRARRDSFENHFAEMILVPLKSVAKVVIPCGVVIPCAVAAHEIEPSACDAE